MRRSKYLLIAFAAALAGTSVPASARSISVSIDKARVIEFKTPVTTVYVGNPSMADVNMIDSRHAFVLGKAFGVTNIIALDSKGNQISNDGLTVFGHTADVVTLNRGPAQFTYTCASWHCEAAPVPGDIKKPYYDPVMSENTNRQSMGQGAAIASASQ